MIYIAYELIKPLTRSLRTLRNIMHYEKKKSNVDETDFYTSYIYIASKLLLEKKTTADSCMNENETTNLKEELKAHARKSYMYNSNRN